MQVKARGCVFLLISVLNPGFLTEASPADREKGGLCEGMVASFKPQLDICSFPRRIPTPVRISLSRDFDGSQRDARAGCVRAVQKWENQSGIDTSKVVSDRTG